MLPLTYPSPSGGGEKKTNQTTNKKLNKPKAQVFGSPDNFFCLVMVEAVLQRGLDMFKLVTRKLRPINCNNA